MSQKPEPDTFYFFSLETTGIDMSVWTASHNRTDWIICPFHPQGWTCRWEGCCEPHSLWSWSLLLPKKQGKRRTDCAQQNCHSANRLAWICLLSPATTLSLRSNYKRVSREEGEDAEHLFTQSTYYQRLRWWTSSKMCACIFITFTKCVHTHTHTHTARDLRVWLCQIAKYGNKVIIVKKVAWSEARDMGSNFWSDTSYYDTSYDITLAQNDLISSKMEIILANLNTSWVCYVTQIKERSSMEKISSGTYTQADSRTHSWLTFLHDGN